MAVLRTASGKADSANYVANPSNVVNTKRSFPTPPDVDRYVRTYQLWCRTSSHHRGPAPYALPAWQGPPSPAPSAFLTWWQDKDNQMLWECFLTFVCDYIIKCGLMFWRTDYQLTSSGRLTGHGQTPAGWRLSRWHLASGYNTGHNYTF